LKAQESGRLILNWILLESVHLTTFHQLPNYAVPNGKMTMDIELQYDLVLMFGRSWILGKYNVEMQISLKGFRILFNGGLLYLLC
jgi:hypothetical protein